MESKHTEGPWRISKYSPTGVENQESRSIATTGSWSNNQLDPLDVYNEQKANAKLIVEAPELLKMLIDSQSLLEQLQKMDCVKFGKVFLSSQIEENNKTIQKATS